MKRYSKNFILAKKYETKLKTVEVDYQKAIKEIRQAKEYIGINHAMFFPATVNMTTYARDQIIIPTLISSKFVQTDNINTVYQNIPLSVLTSKMYHDKEMRMYHIKVRFKDKTVGYALTEEAVMYTPRHHLLEYISEVVAASMIGELK